MRLISRLSLAAAAALLGAGSSLAQTAPALQRASADAPRPQVYVCDTSDSTRRAFEQEFGRAEFVTAEDVAAGRVPADGTPRCITEGELRRAQQLRAKLTSMAAR